MRSPDASGSRMCSEPLPHREGPLRALHVHQVGRGWVPDAPSHGAGPSPPCIRVGPRKMASTSLQAHTVAAPTNEETAQLLDEVAGLFEAQRAKVFRAMAYRRAASAPRALGLPVTEAAAGGSTSLMAALGVGPRLARTIAMILRAASRRW